MLEDFEHEENTYRDALELHRLVLTKPEKGEKHALIRRKAELNGTVLEMENSTLLDTTCSRDKDQWGMTWKQVRSGFLGMGF